jgi:hypothetical protein
MLLETRSSHFQVLAVSVAYAEQVYDYAPIHEASQLCCLVTHDVRRGTGQAFSFSSKPTCVCVCIYRKTLLCFREKTEKVIHATCYLAQAGHFPPRFAT